MKSIVVNNARVGINSIQSHEDAIRVNRHILRMHGKVYGNADPSIYVAVKPEPGAFLKKNTLSIKQKKQLESRLQVLRSLDQITTNHENEIKKIETELGIKRVIKKNQVKFVEMIFCITKMPPNPAIAGSYADQCSTFIETTFGQNVELITLVVHLDQGAMHAHAIIRIINKSWSRLVDELANPIYCANQAKIMREFSNDPEIRTKLLCELRREENKPYYIFTKLWHDQMEIIFHRKGLFLEPLKRYTAKDYTKLKYFKEASQQLVLDQHKLDQDKQTTQHLLKALPFLSEQEILSMDLNQIVEETEIYRQTIERLRCELQEMEKQKNDLQTSLCELKSEDDDLMEMKRIFNKA